MNGFTSHTITNPIKGNVLRYTSFVEVTAPLFSLESLLKLYHSFDFNDSSWGFDYYWPFKLGYPKDKIAILDKVTMTHTNPVGGNYDRFPTHPSIEMDELLTKYNINPITPFLISTFMYQLFQSVFTGLALGAIYGRIEEDSELSEN